MDFHKLRGSGEKIKMPNDMKKRIKENCIENITPVTVIRARTKFNARLIMVCVCCFLLLICIGLKNNGMFDDNKIPVETVSHYTTLNYFLSIEKDESPSEINGDTTSETHNADETTVQITTQKATQTEIEVQVTKTEEYYTREQTEQGVMPHTLYLDDLNKLKNAKKAAETNDFEYYHSYLDENGYDDVSWCFYYPQEYLDFCKNEIYIPVVDSEKSEILWFYYVPEYGRMNMGVDFNEDDSFRFYIEMSGEFTFRLNNDKQYIYEETIKSKNYTADIYRRKIWYQNTSRFAWDGYGIELTVDGQKINILATDDVTLEELKEYLSYVDFVKIKDWI